MSTTVGTLTIEMAANIARLQKDMDAARKSVATTMGSIEKSIQTAMRSASALFAGVGVSAFVGKLVNVQREFDVLNASLVTVTGSSAEAERAFSWIRDFAATTPFSLNEVTQAFVKMKALGLDASEEALRSYGNTASAMGKSLNQMIEAVADAATGEFERLKEFGIRAKSEGDRVSLTFRGVTTNIGKNAAEIEAYLRRIGDVEFAGAMELRAKTLDGTLSNLADTWDQLFRTISSGDAGGLIAQGAQMALKGLESLIRVIEAMNTVVSSSAAQSRTFGVILEGLATVFETVAVVGVNVKYVISQIINEVAGLGAQIAALASGNFAEAGRIREQMLAQADAARREVDMTTKAILDSRNAQSMSAKEIDNDLQRLGNRWAATGSAAALAYKAQLSAANQTVPKITAMTKEQSKELERQRREELAFGEYMNRVAQERAEEQARLLKEQARLHEESLRPYLAGVQAAEDRVQAMRDEERALEISQRLNISLAEAVEMVNIAKLQEKQIDALGNEEAVMALQREIDAREKLLGLIASKEARDANTEAARKAAEDWDRTWNQVSQSMTDALMQGGKSVKEYLVGLFRTMVLRPLLQPIVGGLMGTFGMSGAASAATGGAANALGIGAAASTLGSYALTGFMNTVAGTGLSASLTAAGGMSGVASAGMALGALIAPVAIGAAIANAVGLFRSTKTVGGGLMGTLGAGNLQSYDLMRKGGSLFSGPSYRLGGVASTPETQALEQAFLTIRSQSAEMARALGISGDEVQRFTMAVGDVRVHPDINQLGLVLDGLSSEQRAAKIAELLQKSADGMAEVILGAGATAQQLAQIYAQAMQERAGLEMELLRLQGNTAEIRRRERDALHESNRALYDRIRALEDSKAAAEAATQAERQRTQALIDAAAAAMQSIMDDTASLIQQQISASAAAANAARQAAEAYRTAGQSLIDTARALRGEVSPGATAATAYRRALAAAQGGDVGAMQSLPALAQAYAESLRGTAGNRAQYLAGTRGIAAELESVAAEARGLAAQRSAQATLLDVNTEVLRVLSEDLQSGKLTVDLLREHQNLLTTIAQELSDTGSVVYALSALDDNVDGLLTFDELKNGLSGKATDEQILALIDRVDRNGDGQISQLELVAASIEARGADQAQWLSVLNDSVLTSFSSLDSNVNGLLTFDELKTGLDGKATDQQISELIARVDSNGDNQISQLELVAASLDLGAANQAEQLSKLNHSILTGFGNLDTNVNGLLTFEELKEGLAGKATDDQILALINRVDSNGDGQISKAEALRQLQADSLQKLIAVDDGTGAIEKAQLNALDTLLSSDSTLARVLGRLSEPDASAEFVAGTIVAGNKFIGQKIDDLTAAMTGIQKAQEERQRQEELLTLQSQLMQAKSDFDSKVYNMLYERAQQEISRGRSMNVGDIRYTDPSAYARAVFTNRSSDWYKMIQSFVNEPTWQMFGVSGSMLGTIDDTIVSLRQQIRDMGGVPQFSMGGMHTGGLRLVGENGPELEVTGPSRIYNANQTAAMLGGAEVADEIRALHSEMVAMRAEMRATAVNTGKTKRILERVTRDGEAVQTVAA